MNKSFVESRIVLSIQHHKKFLVCSFREMKFSNSFLNRSEIPPDRRQLKLDLSVAVSEDIAFVVTYMILPLFFVATLYVFIFCILTVIPGFKVPVSPLIIQYPLQDICGHNFWNA